MIKVMQLVRLFIVFVSVVLLTATPGHVQKSNETRLKSKYFLLEGMKYLAENKNDAAHELFKKAYDIDNTAVEASYQYGLSLSSMKADTISQYLKSLSLMRPFIDKYPKDYQESEIYAFIAYQCGEIDEAIRIYQRQDSLFPEESSNLLYLANAYATKNELDKAINCYNRYETIEGKNPKITLQKFYIHIHKGDTTSAINEADLLIKSNPTNPANHIMRGDIMAYINRPDSAVASYIRAEQIAPENGEAKLALASYYKHIGDSISFDKKVYEAIICDDYDIYAKVELLTEYIATLIKDNVSTQRADHIFSVLRDQYPHEESLLDLGARYSAVKNMWNDAIEQISYAIDMNPLNQTYWGQLMTYYLYDDNYKKAEEVYHNASKLFDPPQDMTMLLASAYNLSNQIDKAITTYIDMLSKELPNHNVTKKFEDKLFLNTLDYDKLEWFSVVFSMLGDSYFKCNDTENTFIAYENSIFFLPVNSMSLNNYAYYLAISGGDLDKAEEMSLSANNLEPDNPIYMDTYAWILFLKEKYEEAKLYQESAIEKCNGNPEPEFLNHYGDILFKNGETEQAVENWIKALAGDPENKNLQKKIEQRTYIPE